MRTHSLASIILIASFHVIAGCAAHGDDVASDDTEALTTERGVDYSWGRPGASTLRSHGYTFAARYLSFGTGGKDITAAEANALHAAGVHVVLVWEAGGNDVMKGYNEGVAEARAAEQHARAAGMPAGRPIYFAIDFDEQSSQQATVNAYFDGVASVIGRHRTGAYAGYYAIKRLFDAGKITWGWQTYAWSHSHWDPRAQLRQVKNGATVGGAQVDLDSAVVADFGQW